MVHVMCPIAASVSVTYVQSHLRFVHYHYFVYMSGTVFIMYYSLCTLLLYVFRVLELLLSMPLVLISALTTVHVVCT